MSSIDQCQEPIPSTIRPPEQANADLGYNVFAGGGEMGNLMHAFDWTKTPLGAPETWPQSLRTSVSICLASRFPIVLYWGREYVVLYNDAYSQILGKKHPWALGQTCRTCWSEIWDTIGPMLNGVVETGTATWSDDLLLKLERFGYPEECYFSFSFSPVRVETGSVGGVFTAVIETTEKVVGERRLRTLRDLAARSVEATSEEEVWRTTAALLAQNDKDVPFAVLCSLTEDRLRVVGTSGISPEHPFCQELCNSDSEWYGEAMLAARSGHAAELDLSLFDITFPLGSWENPPKMARLMPISALGQGASGILVAAVSPAKALDESYRTFYDLMARQIATSIADARSYEEERRRAESLAELDRAKMLFFNNVSHELRTPLTLMLGPLEEMISNPEDHIGAEERKQLTVVHRSSLRLLKLVNTLLDFSRIEAGRVQAIYEPTDLAQLTSELASTFRSAIEKAGLFFEVNCPALPEQVYVDRDMWEKIVLNLLSNAFKFTFVGGIRVELKPTETSVELSVSDTGTGIPEDELPRIFERFHRIENASGRTHEGTGIGLALVQELTKLHGGVVRVRSRLNQGSTFVISIPTGTAHLPADRLGAQRTLGSTATRMETYLDEARQWAAEDSSQPDRASIFDADSAPNHVPEEPAQRETVVVADDNADMRSYIARLLGSHYRVFAVRDGIEAVETARNIRPSLVLSDVMMPRLDGFGVLNAIRTDADLRAIPVILLSARAGEESRVEGLDAGADDYLVKPFTARELLARVAAHVNMAKVRRQAAEQESRLRTVAEQERKRLQQLLAEAPAAIGLLSGPEHRWIYVNRDYIRLTGRDSADDFIGRTVSESLPEIRTQALIGFLDEVYRTGNPHFGHEMRIVLNRSAKGLSDECYWDFVYQPVRDDDGTVEGILVHGVEVTDRVLARKAIETSEKKYRDFAETATIGLHWVGPDGTILWANQAELDMLGYTAQEYIGRNIGDFHLDEPVICDILDRLSKGEKLREYEARLRGKDGSIRQVIIDSSVLFEEGKFVHTRCFTRDVTEQKLAVQALRESEQRLRVVTDATPVMIWMSGTDKLCYYFNKSWLDFVGRTLEEEMGNGWAEGVHPDDFNRCLEIYVSSFDAREPFEMEYRLRHHSGEYRWILDHGVPRYAPDGTFEGYLGGCLDVHNEKEAAEKLRKATEALRTSEERFRALVNASSYVVYRMSPDWTQMLQLDGRGFISDAQRATDNWIDVYIDPRDQQQVLEAIRTAIENKSVLELEHRVRRVDGTLGWTLSRAVPLFDDQGNITEWFGAATDVTARKEAEEAQRRLAVIVKCSDDAIISKDLNGIVTSWNPAAEKLFGYTAQEMIGLPITAIIPPELQHDEQDILAAIGRGHTIDHFDTIRLTKSGERIQVSVTISPVRDENGNIVGAAKIARDITRQKQTEQAVRTTERLAAVGRLAATVAHEINNPLASVTNLIYLSKQSAVRHDVKDFLTSAEEELERISHLTKQTLGFYRESKEATAIRLGDIVTSTISVFAAKARNKGVSVEPEVRSDPEIYALASELRQVIGNLLSNSIDAVEIGGRIRLRVSAISTSGLFSKGVRLTVADSGPGIPDEVRAHIFEPFFTTKRDVGTGLGMWICKSIVDRYCGSIKIRSTTEEGKTGTVISIVFPLSSQGQATTDKLKQVV
ncbi:MAG TPA: PAS domain S-box protein [Terracidiphilus sp.]|nr:PAS domain S-box protein [Terracidiphilus sp.]